jgi:hypothetical protein
MLISQPGLSSDKVEQDGSTLTPMMIRGAIILWHSELKSGR